MPSSDLLKRLEHLISYSSGLTFIKTDPQAPAQSQTIDMLLAEQSENIDLAVLKVHEDMAADDFRRQLAQQVFGPNNAHTGQSIPTMLHPLGQFTEALLICISQGENLPEVVLQECWQLVTTHNNQSDHARVNVLIFAHSAWAEQATNRLPSSGLMRPVMLSIQGASTTARPELIQGSELEQLISHKRQAFAQRLLDRDAPVAVAPSLPVLKKPWFLWLVGILFVVIFGAILLLQYPQFPDKILDPQGKGVFPGKVSAPAKQGEKATPQNIATPSKAPSPTEPQNTPQMKPQDIPEPKQDALVSTWQSETARIDQAALPTSPNDKLANQTTSPLNPPSQPVEHKRTTRGSTDVQVGALPRPSPERAIPPKLEVTTQADLTTPASQQPLAPPGNIKGPSYSNDESALLALKPEGYVLQIIGLASRQAMEDYVLSNQLKPFVWIYQTQLGDKDWYVLLNNQYYPSLAAAVRAISALPRSMRQVTPFPKNVDKVQQEIRKPQ